MIEARPMTEQECLEANLTPKGVYKYKIITCLEKRSDNSGDFFSLKMEIKPIGNYNLKPKLLFDNLFFTEKMMWKTRHFYASSRKMNIYESGKFRCIECEGLEGYLEIDHRKRKDNGQLESFVKDYIVPETQNAVVDNKPFIDDVIPDFK